MTLLTNDGAPFTCRIAENLGLGQNGLHRLTKEGHIRRVCRGVYVDSAVPDTRQLRLEAIRLIAPPHSVVCNESASWLMGANTFKPSEQHLLIPSFLVPHSTTRITIAGAKCRQAILKPTDVFEIDGVRLTTPLRTASDLLRRLYRPYALSAADGMAHLQLVDTDELWEFVSRLKGYPGIVQARTLALIVDPRAASAGESWLRLRVHDAGFPPPVPQFAVVDDRGHEFFLDLAYPEVKVAIEYDGREFHTGKDDREHDRSRRRHLSEMYGWRWAVARRESIFGANTSFEESLGGLIGMPPLLPRRWGRGDARTLSPKVARGSNRTRSRAQ
ncbi:hypothetical protein [Aeromicrobium sp.]